MNIVFIGSGNMGSAMMKGMLAAGAVAPQQLIATAAHGSNFPALQQLGIQTTLDNCAAARQADVLFLAVKPNRYADVIAQIREDVPANALIVSIAAGQTLHRIQTLFGGNRKIAAVMPNTPAMVGESMSAYCVNEWVTEEEKATLLRLLCSFGKAQEVPETQMDAVCAVSGSSPAYIYMLVEAMADGAVLSGMPRKQAYLFAAQAVLGAAKMVLESGAHPGALKDAVCSPGGTTIEAVSKLEEAGFRHAVLAAEAACAKKFRAMLQ